MFVLVGCKIKRYFIIMSVKKINISQVNGSSEVVKFMRPWPRYISSLWPICSSFRVGQVLLSLCLWFHEGRILLFTCRFLIGLLCAGGWV